MKDSDLQHLERLAEADLALLRKLAEVRAALDPQEWQEETGSSPWRPALREPPAQARRSLSPAWRWSLLLIPLLLKWPGCTLAGILVAWTLAFYLGGAIHSLRTALKRDRSSKTFQV